MRFNQLRKKVTSLFSRKKDTLKKIKKTGVKGFPKFVEKEGDKLTGRRTNAFRKLKGRDIWNDDELDKTAMEIKYSLNANPKLIADAYNKRPREFNELKKKAEQENSFICHSPKELGNNLCVGKVIKAKNSKQFIILYDIANDAFYWNSTRRADKR
jgi:hypothetical protein